MPRSCKLHGGIIAGACGIGILVLGIVAVVREPLVSYAIRKVHEEIALVEGRAGFESWSTPTDLYFKIYIFNVTNPDNVMQGELPKLVECGPYIYDELMEKKILEIDEENDEILYTVKRTLHFNKKQTGNLSQNDEITLLNPAYLGTINTLAGFPPTFMRQYGDSLPKLFPNPKSIFIKGKVKDILFDGLKLTCNDKKYKDLQIICKTLKGKKPPIMRNTDTEGVYLYSFFDRMNGTIQGPFTINRGVKDIWRLGDLTSVNGKRVQKYWHNKTCNIVKGTDSITWAPMETKIPKVFTYVEDACRTMFAEYKKEVVVHGMVGWKYVLSESHWEPNEMDCYCPVVKKKKECIPKGLLDITKCQQAPILSSEPHFMHGDPELLNYALGLKPGDEQHYTFVTIDPITGAPLQGQKRIQLNMKLSKQDVVLLQNVSEGYFPLIWCGDVGKGDQSLFVTPYQVHRLINVLWFLQWLPIIIGIYVILLTLFLCQGTSKTKKRVGDPIESVSSDRSRDPTRRRPSRAKRMFE